ncbi:MAG: hypothetical protein K8R37_08975, partial [Bacteroidales bacterium]|nr:hypothetical protein [Bacteroidales bacterium]
FTVAASAGIITSLSDLTFAGTNIDLNGDSLIMPATKGSVISLTGGRIEDGYVQSNFGALYMANGAYIGSNFTITDITLEGMVQLNGSGIEFIGEIINNAFLWSYSGVQSTATITGNITNNDTITNYSSSYRLSLNISGDITNNGVWTNYNTILNGVDDQLIYLIGGKEMTGQFRFNAMINDPPYQWKWNDVILNSSDFSGETSNSLVWQVPVSNDYIGEFICYGAASTSRTISIRSGIIIDPVVQLQGPYNLTNMNTDLTAQQLIPIGQPFNVAPWNYSGDETLTLIPPDIVDWILVEFRETAGGPEDATSDSIVFRRALMLQNDGRVIDPGTLKPELKCDIDFEDNIYLVIWHRNHLGVMSAVPISGGNTPAYYDFSESASQAYGGTDALIDLGNGVYGMMTGDANADGYIGTSDKTLWENQAGSQAYVSADFNMDSQVNNPDKNDYWYPNIGESCQVPISFTCGDNFIDYRDGQTYSTVQIGTQCWMVENLNIGTMINGSNEQTDNSTIEKYCYNNNTSNCDTYGGLYQWNEIMEYTTTPGTQGICPSDWHIPTDEELKQLEGEVDSYYGYPDPEWDGTGSRGTDAGSNLKSTSGWSGGNGTDLYGFTLLPGGRHSTITSFGTLGESSYLWSSSQFDGTDSWSRTIYYMFDTVNRFSGIKECGYSVRCLKD